MPVLTVFAGPNGSGKSSVIRLIEFEGSEHLLEADAIAKRINPSDSARAALPASREVLRRTYEYIEAAQNFAIETTLAGIWINTAISTALRHQFFVRLICICVDNAERSIQRVHERVAQGGHDVPDNDVRRRYRRSLANLENVIKLANQVIVYDNSGPESKVLLEIRAGVLLSHIRELPVWAHPLSKLVTDRS